MNSVGPRDRREGKLDGHELVVLFAVAVLDGVDHRFADGDADPVDGIFVEPGQRRQPVAHDLNDIQQLVVTRDLQANRSAARKHGMP